MNASITDKESAATIKSKRLAKIAEIGNISRGKNIFVTKLQLLVRLLVQDLIELIKSDHGKDLTIIDVRSELSMLFPETNEKASFMSNPAATITIGIRRAHIKPMTDCLYLIFISRHAKTYKS
jgi:hypothetical protein